MPVESADPILEMVDSPWAVGCSGGGFTNASASLFAHVGSPWPAKDQANVLSPMKINGQTYPKGVGMLANGWVQYALSGLATQFHAEIGLDDRAGPQARVVFWVWLDGNLAYDSGIISPGAATQVFDLGVQWVQVLTLEVLTAQRGGATGGDVCDWGNAYLVCY